MKIRLAKKILKRLPCGYWLGNPGSYRLTTYFRAVNRFTAWRNIYLEILIEERKNMMAWAHRRFSNLFFR